MRCSRFLILLVALYVGRMGSIPGERTALAATNASSCSAFATFNVGSGYKVQNNAFNLQNGGQQCINVDTSGTDWNETSTNSVPTNGAPGGYPSIYAGCHWGTCSSDQHGMPMQESQIASAPTTWNVTPSPNGNWDIAYDIWLNANSTTTNNATGLELMIWINKGGTIQPAGSVVASNVSINGHTWNIWRSGSTQNSGTISYVATSGFSSVNFDLVSFFHDLVNRGYLTSNQFLIDVEAGTEIWTPGSNFQTSSFSVSVSRTAGPPPPTNLTATAVSDTQINLGWTCP
jgi:cellulose 1,4-beta-cellobiosidase